MADPTLYEPGYDFVATDKGAELNVELENIQAAIASVADALADVRRSDGELQNGIVGADALDPLALAAAEPIAAALAEQLEAAIAAVADDVVAAAASAAAAEVSRGNADVAAVSATASAVTATTQAEAAGDAVTAAAASSAAAAGYASAAGSSASAASVSAAAASGSAAAAAASALAMTNTRYAFSARKAADQTGIVTATATKLIFPTELFDFGGYYDAANSRFTPVSGKYRLSIGAGWSGGLVDARQVTVELWKNGAVFRVFGVQVSGTTDNALVSGSCLVEANGTDYFEVYGTGFGVGNKTVAGGVSLSWFEGEAI